MKYIDVEKLKDALARHYAVITIPVLTDEGGIESYIRRNEIHVIQRIIDSLTQEQDLIVINKKDWEAQEQFQKNQDFGKPLQQEQSETDLNADIEMEWDSFNKHLNEYGEESEDVVWLNWNSFADVARNFYELGLKAK